MKVNVKQNDIYSIYTAYEEILNLCSDYELTEKENVHKCALNLAIKYDSNELMLPFKYTNKMKCNLDIIKLCLHL